jgi:hypothetical protein
MFMNGLFYKLFSPEHLLKLPFANDSNSLDKEFYNELLYIIILTIKNNNPNADVSNVEEEIDDIVYELYGLTDEEIAIIEDSLSK